MGMSIEKRLFNHHHHRCSQTWEEDMPLSSSISLSKDRERRLSDDNSECTDHFRKHELHRQVFRNLYSFERTQHCYRKSRRASRLRILFQKKIIKNNLIFLFLGSFLTICYQTDLYDNDLSGYQMIFFGLDEDCLFSSYFSEYWNEWKVRDVWNL